MEEKTRKEMLEALNGKRAEDGLPPLGNLPSVQEGASSRRRVPARGMPPKLMGSRIARPQRPKAPPRNKPCPCGSGRKYKKCCGAPERLRPRVQAVRALPGEVAMPGRGSVTAPDGLPLVATPRDFDPVGTQDIITAEEVERKFDEMVKKTMAEAEDEPEGKIVIAKR